KGQRASKADEVVRVLRDVLLEARLAQRARGELRVEGHRADDLVYGGVAIPGLAREDPCSAHGDGVPEIERRTPRHDEKMVVVAVGCELVSASKFPANRENNREFCRNRPSVAIFVPNEPAASIAYNGIPYATEQGISKRVSGKIFQETGNRRFESTS